MKLSLYFLLVALPMGAQQKSLPEVSWFAEGGYVCGEPAPGCRVPTEAEIKAHAPKQQKQTNKSCIVCDDWSTAYKHYWKIPDGAFPDAVSVETHESIVVKLSDEEYAHLEKLRQAVVDFEKSLAIRYGADLRTVDENHFMLRPDTYTFHRQFILIDRGSQ